LDRKVLDEKSMPPKFSGSKKAREALWKELTEGAYQKEVQKWIKSHDSDMLGRETLYNSFYGIGDETNE
jgi:hypothetical protein